MLINLILGSITLFLTFYLWKKGNDSTGNVQRIFSIILGVISVVLLTPLLLSFTMYAIAAIIIILIVAVIFFLSKAFF